MPRDSHEVHSADPAVSAAPLVLPPELNLEHGKYRVRFAGGPEDVDAALRLRFRVFNLEIGEGLDSSHETGRDRDPFDDCCHHLLVEDVSRGEVIGTYRMQTREMAAAARGFYTAGEFDLQTLPPRMLSAAVEVGRAAIDKPYRNRQVLFLLWKGLAAYMTHYKLRYLFGCCSITTQDPVEGLRMLRYLTERGHQHEETRIAPLPGLECVAEGDFAYDPAEITVPILFGTYLRYGAKICGPPAIDREFKTIDFFVVLDIRRLNPALRRLFFSTVSERASRPVRGAFKLAAFVVWTLVFYILLAAVVPLLNFLRLPGTRWAAPIFRAWGRWGAWIVGMRMEVQGRPPRAPFLLVSNHLSYVDVVVLASQLGGVFVARGDVAGWPVAGAMCRAADTIFVDRDNRRDVDRVLRRMEEMLRQGRGVVLFPEGTSSPGQTVLPFRPSLLAAAARSGLPVFHASLTYVAAPGGPSPATTVCWWGDMTLGRHVVELFRLPGFSVKVRFGERPIREDDRKILAGKLHEAVRARFEPVSAEVSPAGISGRLTAGPAGG